MMGAIGTALSGTQIQTARVSASAMNLANLNSRGALPDSSGTVTAGKQLAYQPSTVESLSLPNGVRPVARSITPAYTPAYDPNAPYADDHGMVASPNVDIGTEITNQLSARTAFAANLKTVSTADQMFKSLLDLKA